RSIRQGLALFYRGDAEQLLANRAGIGRFKHSGQELAHLLERVLMHERRHSVPVTGAHGRDESIGNLLRSLGGLRLGALRLRGAGGQRYQQQHSDARTPTSSCNEGLEQVTAAVARSTPEACPCTPLGHAP